VLEAIDPAAAILDFVRANRVDHLLVGARQSSLRRTLLGSVTVVRPSRVEADDDPRGERAA
jgi:eukaryotic-like serine/threonine-protein kinase